MNILLIGPPGAGKGTQAAFITKKLNIPHISTGDMLRAAIAAGSPLGLKARSIMEQGALVSDEIVIALVKERLKQTDCNHGFLFDGFPRTIAQADALEKAQVLLDLVIEIAVPDEVIVKRLSGRRFHLASGRSYHVLYNPPRIEGCDDVTREPLIQREDDHEETIRKRLSVYQVQTEPLRHYYKKLAQAARLQYMTVDGLREINDIKNDIMLALTKIERSV